MVVINMRFSGNNKIITWMVKRAVNDGRRREEKKTNVFKREQQPQQTAFIEITNKNENKS